MAKLTDERRRALQLLARSPNGCTEALMLAHGFESAMLSDLVLNGLAVAVDRSTMAGRRRMKVTWLRITAAGRKAIAGPS
jgi:phage portal protein BeeE